MNISDKYTKISSCMACGKSHLYEYLSLGLQPLANDLKSFEDEYSDLYPLNLNVCKDCWHSQLGIAVNPELLYKNYLYVSGTSKTLNEYFDALANNITQQYGVGKILDIACNDGTFLEKFKKYGWDCYGIDPADNLKIYSEQRGLKIQSAFFVGKGYTRPEERFDLITCFNVLAHIPNPLEFLIEAKHLLSDNGKILIQTSQKDMITQNQFDTAYHEHHSFFSISSFVEIAARAGLFIHDVSYTDIHGGSYLVTMSKTNNYYEISQLDEERTEGRYNLDLYKQFNHNIHSLKLTLTEVIDKCRNDGYSLVGFGAAAKGIVLLNFFDIKLDYVIDENNLKIDRWIAGVNTQIKSMDIEPVGPVCFVVLAWNFYDEIVSKIKNKWPMLDCIFLKVFPEIELVK